MKRRKQTKAMLFKTRQDSPVCSRPFLMQPQNNALKHYKIGLAKGGVLLGVEVRQGGSVTYGATRYVIIIVYDIFRQI